MICGMEYWNLYRPHERFAGGMVMPYPQDIDAPGRACRSSPDCCTDTAGKSSLREEKEFLQPRYVRARKSSRRRGKNAEKPVKSGPKPNRCIWSAVPNLKKHRFRFVGNFPT